MIKNKTHTDPEFMTWKNSVHRTLEEFFGQDSVQLKHFHQLSFSSPRLGILGGMPSESDRRRRDSANKQKFQNALQILTSSIQEYIKEIQAEEVEPPEPTKDSINAISKVFISHASSDGPVVEELVDLLETIGLDHKQIFCSSLDGYGIALGENFINRLKDELSSKTLVIFLLSKNFYKSAFCLCEMGAVWVLSAEHMPILIPPFQYHQIEGVLPLTQGMKINDPQKLNLLKQKIEELFGIQNKISLPSWERKRNRMLSRLEQIVSTLEGTGNSPTGEDES